MSECACQRESGRGGRHAREEVRNRERHGERGGERKLKGGQRRHTMGNKSVDAQKKQGVLPAHSLYHAVLYITTHVFIFNLHSTGNT